MRIKRTICLARREYRRFKCSHRARKLGHGCHEWLHLGYFGFVFLEGHGTYSYLAGGLLLVGVGIMVLGVEDDNTAP